MDGWLRLTQIEILRWNRSVKSRASERVLMRNLHGKARPGLAPYLVDRSHATIPDQLQHAVFGDVQGRGEPNAGGGEHLLRQLRVGLALLQRHCSAALRRCWLRRSRNAAAPSGSTVPGQDHQQRDVGRIELRIRGDVHLTDAVGGSKWRQAMILDPPPR